MSAQTFDLDALKARCLPFLRGEAVPQTAGDMMASRYIAYSTGDVDYILATHDPATRDETDREATEEWAKTARFHGLSILSSKAGGPSDDEGEVEFIALYEQAGREHEHHERSTFRRIEGKWYFVDAKVLRDPVRRAEPKVGRNDPCPCGSGKKYKKCHGASGASAA